MKRTQEHELRKYVGDMSSLIGIVPYTMNDGAANGVRALGLRNGRNIELTMLQDRGLDIPELRYRGMNMGFGSKTGITHPAYYQEDGARGFLRRFNAGLLTTCGITYAGAACEDGGRKLGLHGPYSNTPAEQVAFETVYELGEAVLRVRGQVREACVFEENMRLTRELRLQTERDILTIEDTVENLGFEESPSMMVYHVNFGYPLLDEGARIYCSAKNVQPRDEIAGKNLGRYDLMEAPGVLRPEECFFHTNELEVVGFAMLHNEKLGVAAILKYDTEVFPLLCEWKCMRAGDYALGLEPTTAGVLGRAEARKTGMGLPMIAPGDSRTYWMSLELTEDRGVIEGYIAKARRGD